MKIGRDSCFWDIYQSTTIRIPQIQRDYIQGRDNERVKQNRENFIKEIIAHLLDETKGNMNLNFVYGYYDKDDFIPIDGQQRLTTLFLLHLYVFAKSNHKETLFNGGKMNFSYETRYTTNRFFKDLYQNADILKEDIEDIKKGILKSSWFAYNWKNDPSVFSSVVTLDTINRCFKEENATEWERYYNRLINNCPIRFMLLEMDKTELGKPNQLYIRMNSRGKQLTDFENFKAALYGYIDKSENQELKRQKEKMRERIDGDWQTMIWELEKEEDSKIYSDIFYRDIIHWIILNRLCSKGKITEDHELLKKSRKDIFLESYAEVAKEDFLQCVKDIYFALETLCAIKSKDRDYFESLITKNGLGYNIDKKYICNLDEYKPRILLFAITKFGEKKEIEDDKDFMKLKQWLRIVINLANNTEYNNLDIFNKACNSIDNFDSILDIADNKDKIDLLEGFNQNQKEEEKFKQGLINSGKAKDVDWEKVIVEKEQHPYFQGEIRFSFVLSNIDFENCGADKLKEYNNLWQQIEKVMTFAKDNDVLYHRVLLTYGDYSVTAPGKSDLGIYSFFQYTESHHNYDWRGFLRGKNDGKDQERLRIFLEFLTDCENKEPLEVAKEKIESYGKMSGSLWDEVRYYLIKHPELFEYCKKYYYIWHDKYGNWDRYLLMNTSKRNAYKEVKSAVFEAIMGKEAIIDDKGDPYDEENRRRCVIYEGNVFEYKKDCFTDKDGNPLSLDSKEVKTAYELLTYCRK